MTNTSNLPVEALELEYPLTLLRYELVDGSGGAGTFRGGMGLRRVYRAEADCRVRRRRLAPALATLGSAGGLPGGKGEFAAARGRTFNRDGAVLKAGRMVEIITPGAGGYGPPGERDRERVARDVREGRIDPEQPRDLRPQPHEQLAMTLSVSRRSFLLASAALPFLRMAAFAAATSGSLVFGLSSHPPNLDPWGTQEPRLGR